MPGINLDALRCAFSTEVMCVSSEGSTQSLHTLNGVYWYRWTTFETGFIQVLKWGPDEIQEISGLSNLRGYVLIVS